MNTKISQPSYTDTIKLPQLSRQGQLIDPFAKDVYSCFINHFYNTGTRIIELKVFEAIQATAITMDISNAFASKTLVELGLRAPRKAFPASFLDFIDKSNSIKTSKGGVCVSPALASLKRHWQYMRDVYSAQSTQKSA